jgi:hypothetical protein
MKEDEFSEGESVTGIHVVSGIVACVEKRYRNKFGHRSTLRFSDVKEWH